MKKSTFFTASWQMLKHSQSATGKSKVKRFDRFYRGFVFGFPASFSKELHQLGYYALFVHQVSNITTRPLQCEVNQRNFFKDLPVQQRNFLQYGAGRVYKGHFFVDFGFVWGFVLASFGDTTFHALQEEYTCKHPTKKLRFLFSGFVFQGMCKILQDPTKIDQFYKALTL